MLTIDWLTKVIFVPKSYTQFVSASPFEIRQLDIDVFRLDLRAIEADNFGIVNERTHTHNTTVTVGGVTLARVINIVNGYTVTFEDAPYGVNLAGANSNIADVTNLNQVQIRSANSAGLTYSKQINDQSFTNGRVYINVEGGLSGIQFPRGSLTDPTNNWSDAHTIADNTVLNGYELNGALVYTDSTPMTDSHIISKTPLTSSIEFDGRSISGSTFAGLTLFGEVEGSATFKDCVLGTATSGLTGFEGFASNCGFIGSLSLSSGSSENIIFNNCISLVAGSEKPILDCNNTSSDIHIRNYTGGLDVRNFTTSGASMSIDVIAGEILIDSTCTEGTIVVRGVARLEDNSGPNCNVVVEGLLDSVNLSGATGLSGATITDITNLVWDTLSAGNVDAGTFGKIMADLLTKANEEQHILNVHTEMLKD